MNTSNSKKNDAEWLKQRQMTNAQQKPSNKSKIKNSSDRNKVLQDFREDVQMEVLDILYFTEFGLYL